MPTQLKIIKYKVIAVNEHCSVQSADANAGMQYHLECNYTCTPLSSVSLNPEQNINEALLNYELVERLVCYIIEAEAAGGPGALLNPGDRAAAAKCGRLRGRHPGLRARRRRDRPHGELNPET